MTLETDFIKSVCRDFLQTHKPTFKQLANNLTISACTLYRIRTGYYMPGKKYRRKASGNRRISTGDFPIIQKTAEDVSTQRYHHRRGIYHRQDVF